MTAPEQPRCLLAPGARVHPSAGSAHQAAARRGLSVTRCPCGCGYRTTSSSNARRNRRDRRRQPRRHH